MLKRLKFVEIYTTVIFGLFVATFVDLFASFRFDAWGFFEVEKVEFRIILVIFGIYPAAAAAIINWYPYESVWWHKFSYLMGWSIFSTAYEWLTMKVEIIWHHKWNLFLSFLLYPVVYYMLIVHVKIYRWLTRKDGRAK